MERFSLNKGWSVKAKSSNVPENIAGKSFKVDNPSSVHTCLLNNGAIDDPLIGMNEWHQRFIGLSDWEYACEFAIPDMNNMPHEKKINYDLCFDGIDTISEIILNNKKLGTTKNMFRSYRFEVEKITKSENSLKVNLFSPVKYANEMSMKLGPRPIDRQPYNAIRKMPCSFGWDWGPEIETLGIQKDVYLEAWQIARLKSVKINSTVEEKSGIIDLSIDLEKSTDSKNEQLQIKCTLGNKIYKFDIDKTLKAKIKIDNPKLWNPRGLGDPNLYNFSVELFHREKDLLDKKEKKIGFKKVELDLSNDKWGQKFAIKINGKDIFIKGSNWIPNDALIDRLSKSDYYKRIKNAFDSNQNLLRVWGGGIYENDWFYEICDELGILVWQDCMFACAAYSEDEPLYSEIEKEIYENLERISSHASLTLINGSNENVAGWQNWGWKKQLDIGASWGEKYYYSLFPIIAKEAAPYIPYIPSSPYSPSLEENVNNQNTGSMHVWNVWFEEDYLAYNKVNPRFAAEFGWQAPANAWTIEKTIFDNPLTPESPEFANHQKAFAGNNKLTSGLLYHFRYPKTFSDWHWAMQLNQAYAFKTGIEHFRSLMPYCQGSIIWQLNDCWSATSWSIIDFFGIKKPSYYAVAQAYAPAILTIQRNNDENLVLHLINDSSKDLDEEIKVQKLQYDGKPLYEKVYKLNAKSGENKKIEFEKEFQKFGSPKNEFLSAWSTKKSSSLSKEQTEKLQTFYFPLEPKDSALQKNAFSAKCEKSNDGYKIKIKAKTLIRDIFLQIDKLLSSPSDAEVFGQFQTILPGESGEIKIVSKKKFDEKKLVSIDILRCANQLI
ncbi:MAG: hypothetical protein LBB07_02985 [Bifidobacteriaceae bacterium]|nr:hypothetical protein [Bifidobacteriaceae bacterium]